MNNFEYPSLIEKDNDNFDFLSSFANVETPKDNDLFEDLFENEEEVKIDIDNEDYCQEEQFIHSFNKYNDDLNANYILNSFDSSDMIECPPNNINNMYSLHEDKIIMNVDRQIKNNHMAENNDINNDIKENLNGDVAIFTSANSSSFICPTAPNTPVKKEQISKESIQNLTKRKISKSNSKILKKKDSDVPPKRVNMRELKCKRKLEETKEDKECDDECISKGDESSESNSSHSDGESFSESKSADALDYTKLIKNYYDELKEPSEETLEKSDRLLEEITNGFSKETFLNIIKVKSKGRPEKKYDFRFENLMTQFNKIWMK